MIRRIAIFKNASVRAGFLPIMGVCINATKLPIIIGIETDFWSFLLYMGKVIEQIPNHRNNHFFNPVNYKL